MKKIRPESEARIIERAAQTWSPSVAEELDRLFDAHRSGVERVCRRMTGNAARAEELTQEALLTAWRRLPELQDPSRFGPWVYGIARNLCLNAVRKRSEVLVEDGVVEGEDHTSTLKLLQKQEREQLLRDAAANLDAQEQEAVHMRYVLGLPLERIDALLGLTGSGARGLLQRCKRKLKRDLRARLGEMGHGSSLFRSG